MQSLIISDYGSFLGKHSERLVVKKNRKTVAEHALMNLEQVIVASKGVSLSADLIKECVERGINISLLAFDGKPYAKIVSPVLTATVKTRREQLMAYNDERGVEITKLFAQGKIKNQMNVLKYFGKYRKSKGDAKFAQVETNLKEMKVLLGELDKVEGEKIDEVRSTLLNLEGRAARLYWDSAKVILPEDAFKKREHRGASDPINSLLNYGYGILYSQVWSAIALAGLEPFGGFLHVDRPGKPSLVLDFIEEFRQPVVDRCVFALVNKGFKVVMESPEADAARERRQASRAQGVDDEMKRIEAMPPKGGTLNTATAQSGDHKTKGAEASPPEGGTLNKPTRQGADDETKRQESDTAGADPKKSHTERAASQHDAQHRELRLSSDTRREFAAKILERLEGAERYEGKKHSLKHIIQQQARHLATFLRREGGYKPFVCKW